MSRQARDWAWDQTTPNAGMKVVLLQLAERADAEFRCFPSIGTIAAKTGLSERTVRGYLDRLVEINLVIKEDHRRRPDGTYSTWLYRLNQCPPVATGDREPLATGDRTTVHRSPSPPSTGRRAEPSLEPSLNRASRVSLVSDDRLNHEIEVLDETQLAAVRLCDQLADAIAGRGSKRPNVTVGWRSEMERLLRLDRRTPEQVGGVIDWLANSTDSVASFWRPNVRSPGTLRTRWDQMAEQLVRDRRPTNDKSSAAAEYAFRRADEIRRERER
jgi:hypothetical protein